MPIVEQDSRLIATYIWVTFQFIKIALIDGYFFGNGRGYQVWADFLKNAVGQAIRFAYLFNGNKTT